MLKDTQTSKEKKSVDSEGLWHIYDPTTETFFNGHEMWDMLNMHTKE